MYKRVMISLFAVMSLGALWWTDAEAQCVNPVNNCCLWRVIGGSNVCVKPYTKGMLIEVQWKGGYDCGSEGACVVNAFASATENIAFCQVGNEIVKRECNDPLVTFSGLPEGECDPKHDKDNDGLPGGKGHDKGKHGCTSTVVLAPPPLACEDSCIPIGGFVVDVTPVNPQVNTFLQAFGSEGEEEGGYYGEGQRCTENSPLCTIHQQCTINPNKIQYLAVKPYQCDIIPPPSD